MRVENDVRVIGVFISSPGDVAPERGRAQAVTAKLNHQFEGLVRFETVLWEERFYKADQTFQSQIPDSITCDIVLAIFWTRIGTELPASFPLMPNGQPYPSGTAYELLSAIESSRRSSVPDVYVFRKTADAALPTTDIERRRQAQLQLDALEGFWAEWFKIETGQFKAAFQSFDTPDAFEQQLELLLRQWLETHNLLGPRLNWPKEKGSPFPGLAAFEAEQAAVFFGRDRAIEEARRRLVNAYDRGTPFLLIVGASGAGKSSLARAGLIPRLTTPGVVATVDLWRAARMKPSDGQTGPLAALASALAEALPELAQGDYPTPAVLADNLKRGGPAALQPIVRALMRAAEEEERRRHSGRSLQSALLLLIDQGEELFAQGVGDAERSAFAECLKQLVDTGRVWCVATLRADLYEPLLKEPILKALKETGASLDLGPPGAAELAEIVREPAAAAGLAFEVDGDRGSLDQRLLTDAKTADSLPLLQFTLRRLYEQRVDKAGTATLTHAAYDALGGLEGAIAAEAERAVGALLPESLHALPRLLRHLAEPARDAATLTLRDAPRDLSAEPAEAALINALLSARILIARTDAAGRPTVRLAHDAVLASWPRAAAAAQASRDFYRVRAEVEDAQRRWEQYGRPKDRLIQAGVPLAEAEKLVADFGPELPAPLTAYVTASRNQARKRQRLVAAAAGFFLVLAVGATGAGVFAFRAQQQAILAEQRALADRDKATQSFAIAKRTAERVVFEIAQGLRNVQGLRAETVRKILETSRVTFDQLAQSAPGDLDLQRSLSAMLIEFGDTYSSLGDLPSALRAFNDGLAIQQRLAIADPKNTLWQGDLAVLNARVGTVLVAQGKLEDGLKAHRDALAVWERLARSDPNNTQWQRNLSISHISVGSVLVAQGKLDEALKAYRDALAITERFARSDPGNTLWQGDLATSYNNIGDILVAQGKLEDALKAYRDALTITERVAGSDASNTHWQRNVFVSYSRVGDVLVTQGKLEDALKAYRDALAITERLTRSDPSNTLWQRDLLTTYNRLGDVLVTQGALELALKAYRDALATTERLAQSDPSNTLWQRDLSASYHRLGGVLVAQGRLDDALTVFRDALAIAERLAGSDPSNTQWQYDLSASYSRVGGILLAQEKLEDALKAYRDAVVILEILIRTDPSNTLWQRDLSATYNSLGSVLVEQDRLEDALKRYRDALAIAARLALSDPTNTVWQRDLSLSYSSVGDVLMKQGKLEDALKAYRDGLAVRERLALSNPSNPQWQLDLSRSFDKIGEVLEAQGKPEDALKAYRDGLAIRERLALSDPSNTQWQHELIHSFDKIGDALQAQGKLADALKIYGDRLAIAERLALADPSNTQRQHNLSVSYENIGDVMVAMGNLDEALKVYGDALAIWERLTRADPSNTHWQSDLADNCSKRATAYEKRGDFARALAELRKAHAIMAALVSTAPGNEHWRRDLAEYEERIAKIEAKARG
jgi:tetratricopeptide (TPR) repeat protein